MAENGQLVAQPQAQVVSPKAGSEPAKVSRKRGYGKPFVKGYDARRNLAGCPRTFDQLRKLAQQIAHEELTTSSGQTMTVADAILRSWAKSKQPLLQRAFVEYAFGKVPDKIEAEGLAPKQTLILHYNHERPKHDHDRLSSGLS